MGKSFPVFRLSEWTFPAEYKKRALKISSVPSFRWLKNDSFASQLPNQFIIDILLSQAETILQFLFEFS